MRLKLSVFIIALTLGVASFASSPVSLDSCRTMALANNKQLRISKLGVEKAGYQRKEAFAAYLPAIDFAGGYLYNQKELSIFDSDRLLPTKTFNLQTQTYEFNLAKNPVTGEPLKTPDGQYIPETVALIPKESMTYDIHNVFFGAVTLTQPIYMGGKIAAMNKLTGFAEKLAEAMHDRQAEDVIYAVDAAYWQVVSLKAKYRLAKSYVSLLDTLDHNVGLMLREGVATKADKLSVDVKLNSAKVDLLKVENGLSLSRMALAQVCGLPVSTVLTLEDEDKDGALPERMPAREYNMADVYAARPDLRALKHGVDIAGQQKNVARAAMLPGVALIGAYSFSNPNMFNGFNRKFDGAFSVGAMVTIPLWHWGGNYNKYRAAKADETIMKIKLSDAEDLVNLQVSQASYRSEESVKTYLATRSNLESANENLRTATIGFREGVATADNVMEAQTAWLKANSECIDAMIDVKMCEAYLLKALGQLR